MEWATTTSGPEYVDCKGLERMFGIKRGMAYELMASGDIKSVSLKRRGLQRGKRLFIVESVRMFLERQAMAAQPSSLPTSPSSRSE
jgi:hypothetical protein